MHIDVGSLVVLVFFGGLALLSWWGEVRRRQRREHEEFMKWVRKDNDPNRTYL